MIWESSDWKEPLLKSAKWLRSVKFSDRTQEKTFVRIEKELFIGFYSIRKLLETLKVSDSTKKLKFEVEWYPNKEPVHDLNWHHLDRLYDLSSRHLETRDIGFLCNQFIHSYVFVVAGDAEIDGVYIASDKIRNKKVYFVSLQNILRAFRVVGRDYPANLQFTRDPVTGETRGSAW
ncbi:hypothetical protein DET61_1154 [Marinobacter nauticus]|uniref:Uncharacterized protein n=1 Tax=Marinobacter nauticus TaxID=2743 RepID=A0A368XBB2_MARNT|nr:hypothetical protein [Marinobacter nauticus]RCW64288.1 hypothetical protein DET61_1154 [Marinobacter nauticus]CCG95774.1 hypothetical protein MARHY2300 [Marinobacter nauticus ATCC 49840]